MSTPILPFAAWQSGTNENSIPANDNSLRNEILNGLVISDSTTAQPGSPDDGDAYIIPAGATGTQWATFDEFDLTIYKAGTWTAFAPVEGIVVNIAGTLHRWDGVEYVSIVGDVITKHVNVALSDMVSDLTTGTDKAYWVAPEDGTLGDFWIAVLDPSSSGIVRVDLNKNGGGTILSTRPAIDATENSSLTGTAAVIASAAFVKGDLFRFDLDDAGTDAKALQAILEYTPA